MLGSTFQNHVVGLLVARTKDGDTCLSAPVALHRIAMNDHFIDPQSSVIFHFVM